MDKTSRQPEEGYRMATVLKRLSDAGIKGHRDAVVRASDKFLHISTRPSPSSNRFWTDAEIDQLILAFRLQRNAELQWPKIAEILSNPNTTVERLDEHIATLNTKVEKLQTLLDLTHEIRSSLKADRQTTSPPLHESQVCSSMGRSRSG